MAGANGSILIHEATFSEEEIKEAKARKHSTMNEALRVFRNMNARYCVLTHFSQRYPKQVAGDKAKNVLFAVDGMRIGMSRFHEIVKI